MPGHDASFKAVLHLRAKLDAPVRQRIQVIKGSRRTLPRVCPHLSFKVDLQSLEILFATTLGMVFRPRCLLHVCPNGRQN
jgi:hypothetical protein